MERRLSRAQRSATIQDVARQAGVSRQTVSNVVNSPHIVREETRERVRAAIADLGYSPDAAARRLRTGRSSTIGIHLDPYAGGISGVVLDRFVHALTDRAGDRGMRIQLYAARTPEQEIERMRDLLDGGEIDAVVITGTSTEDPRTSWLTSQAIPFVSFGRPWSEDDVAKPAHLWVDVDGAFGTRAATAHALASAGPSVAFLGWPRGSGTGDDRERGWSESVTRGLRLVSEENVAAARACVADAFARGLLDGVDALVCVSDTLAIGAHLAAIEAGRPALPVIGFDNTPAAEALGLTSVEQLPERVASGVLELLMGPTGSVIRPGAVASGASHVLVEPQLVVR